MRPLTLAGRTQLVIAVAYLAASAAIVLVVNRRDRAQALAHADQRAELLLERDAAIQRYFAEQVQPALRAMPGAAAAPYDLRLNSSLYAVREIDAYIQSSASVRYVLRAASMDARNPRNEADAAERAFIEELRRDPRLEIRRGQRVVDGVRYYEVLRRRRAITKSCLQCHSTPEAAPREVVELYGRERGFGRVEGQVVSATAIRVPLDAAFAEADAFSLRLSLALVAILSALYAAQAVIQRRLLLRPIQRLRDTAVAIADGRRRPEPLPLPPHREVRDLTAAFNAMSQAVERHQQELERQVADRTVALVEANRELERTVREREQARQSEALGRLAGGVAHDFNNLLMAVNGYSDALVESLPEGDPRREDALEIRRAGERASALTRQLLAFSRREVAHARVLEPNRILSEVEGLLRRVIREDVVLALALAESAGPVRIDPRHLEQIVMNLVANSRDAMPTGGRIRLSTRNVTVPGPDAPSDPVPPGRWMVLTVQDQGPGMDADALAHAFDPFFTARERDSSTGLALATAASLVREAGGHPFAESAPGLGSTFRMWLPVVVAAAEPDPEEPRPATAARPRLTPVPASARVLVAEDDPLVRRFLVGALRGGGYDVREAPDGVEALRVIEAGPVDLLVTDLVMPGMDGHQLSLRAREIRPGLSVLFVSGYAPREDLRDRMAACGDAFLAKPFTAETLLPIVARLLAGPVARA
jgi:signal transduction histidine kinase